MSDHVTPEPSVPAPVAPVENVGRGLVFALAAIPAGVAVWLILWEFGFIASIVAFGVVWAAFNLYLRGAGGISRRGAYVILGIVVVTLPLSFFAGMVLDAAKALGDINSLTTWQAFTNNQFWPTFWDIFPHAFSDNVPQFAIAIAFGALGSFRTLRNVFLATSPTVNP